MVSYQFSGIRSSPRESTGVWRCDGDAPVNKGCQESQNGPEIHDFRPVFYWFRGWRWLADGPVRTAFGHTLGHTPADANVCLVSTHCAILQAVKYFAWDDAKNAKLKADRGIGFEDVVFHIERGDLLDILEHPNPERYGGQRIFVVQRDDYVYLVPFVEDEHTVFLKTIIPSRKATRQYLGEESDDET
jgi:uncharacterized DUF497 family protein